MGSVTPLAMPVSAEAPVPVVENAVLANLTLRGVSGPALQLHEPKEASYVTRKHGRVFWRIKVLVASQAIRTEVSREPSDMREGASRLPPPP